MNLDADFATFDVQENGGHIAFSQGNTIITPQVVGTDEHRAVRSTQPARANATSTVEFIFWSPDDSNPSLVNTAGPPLVFGVGNGSATLNDWVGFDANAWGYCPGDGHVYNNNAPVGSTLATATWGDKIGMTLDMSDVSAPTLTIRKNGVPLVTITLPAGAYYYMATISGDPDAIALLGNSGLTRQYYGTGDNGWSLPIDHIAPVLIASDPYMTADTDSPRHEKYDPCLDTLSHPASMSDGVSFWMFGDSAPAELRQGGGLVQFQVNDPLATANIPHRFADLTKDFARNVPVHFGRVAFDGAITAMEKQYAGVLDHAEQDSIQTIQLYVRGMESLLAEPLRRTQFAPSEANQSVRLLSMPIAEGVVRNHEGTVVNAETDQRALHDAAITGFGESRNAGVLMVFGSDFSQTGDGSGVTFAQVTTGKKTFETTSFGGSFNPAGVDYLQGAGDFTTATPHVGGADDGYPLAAGVQWHGGFSNGYPFQLVTIGGHTYMRAQNHADGGYAWFYQNSYVIRSGYTYAFSINVREFPYTGSADPYQAHPAKLVLAYATGVLGENTGFVTLFLTRTGVYTGFFVNNTGADRTLYFLFCSNNVLTAQYVGIDSVFINELPPTGEVVDLPGPGLTQMVKAFAVDRGPLEAYQVSTDDTDAIDNDTGYVYGKHVSETENPSCASCLQDILDSCTSARFGSADFLLRVLRMFKPEDVEDADLNWTLSRDAGDFLSELWPRPDYAENLTARAAGRRNVSPYAEGDYGTSTLAQVPAVTREQLKRDFQVVKTTTVVLHNRYRKALARDPFPTLLDREDDIQDFIDHACGPYADERNFYEADVWMPPGRNLQIGDKCLVTDPKVTDGSQKLVLLGMSPKQPGQWSCKCIFWGL